MKHKFPVNTAPKVHSSLSRIGEYTMRLGKHQKRMLDFLAKYHGQCSISRDSTTRKVARSLEKRGLITVDNTYENWTVRLAGRTY
jgi:hypothetical protein